MDKRCTTTVFLNTCMILCPPPTLVSSEMGPVIYQDKLPRWMPKKNYRRGNGKGIHPLAGSTGKIM